MNEGLKDVARLLPKVPNKNIKHPDFLRKIGVFLLRRVEKAVCCGP